MLKRIISKIGMPFKPKQKVPKVWERDFNTPMLTGRSIKEVLDKDPHRHLEIVIRKYKKDKTFKGRYFDISLERYRHSANFSKITTAEDILIHSHPGYTLPSFPDLVSDINRYVRTNISISKNNKPNLPMAVILVRDPKTHEDIGTTCYTIRGFKDKNSNLTNDPKFALKNLNELSNDDSFKNFKWAMGSLAQGRTYDLKIINRYLDINFKFIPARGYVFNKKKMRFEKIKH